jgi:hypothetical protein
MNTICKMQSLRNFVQLHHQINQIIFLNSWGNFVTVEACHSSTVLSDGFCQDCCVNYGSWSDVVIS